LPPSRRLLPRRAEADRRPRRAVRRDQAPDPGRRGDGLLRPQVMGATGPVKISVEFPSVSYREGPEGVLRLARAVESIGYDHIDIFDHVVMGYAIEGRAPGLYNPEMPILEALMALSYMAAVTSRVTLGTEVLVLPQRELTLVAKQVSTLDTL